MHSRARSCPPPPDKSQFVRLGIMIECLAGLRMCHLEERGGLRGLLGSGTPAFPPQTGSRAGAFLRHAIPSAQPLPSSSRSTFQCSRRRRAFPPAPVIRPLRPGALSRFTDNPLVFPANRLSFNHPLTPLNLSRRRVSPSPQTKVARLFPLSMIWCQHGSCCPLKSQLYR